MKQKQKKNYSLDTASLRSNSGDTYSAVPTKDLEPDSPSGTPLSVSCIILAEPKSAILICKLSSNKILECHCQWLRAHNILQ